MGVGIEFDGLRIEPVATYSECGDETSCSGATDLDYCH
jgi:hypothetical protein